MTKFNVGDTVRILKSEGLNSAFWGKAHEIIAVAKNDRFDYILSNNLYVHENEIELVNSTTNDEDAEIQLEIIMDALMFAALNHPDQEQAEIFLSYARDIVND